MTEYQFETLEAGKQFPVRKTFMDAWEDMYKYVKAMMASGNFSLQLLETSLWIRSSDNREIQSPMYFYDARDYAIHVYGWVNPK